MKRNDIVRRVALLAATAGLLGAPLGAQAETADDPAATDDLEMIGMRFDDARRLVGDERTSALASVEAALGQLSERGYSQRQRSAIAFLSGEVFYELGQFDEASRAFEEARSKAGDGTLANDAWAAMIDAKEAMGDDRDASKEWERWAKRNGDSPLRAEVRLAQAWNAIRREADAEASTHLDAIATTYPWMMSDERVALARATLAYGDGRAADALAALPDGNGSPGVIFLRALAKNANGRPLEAAAAYQELANRYPESPLRDVALLAKANVFFDSGGYRGAADEMASLVETAHSPSVRAEAALRRAAATFLDGDAESAEPLLAEVARTYAGSDVAARAQYLLAEVLWSESRHEDAIVAFNEVLTRYFQHDLAASAQYRVARSLDALGRKTDATGAYQAVTTGYPLAREAPAAAYLAGVGLMEAGKPLAAAPYFQLVLDRYTASTTPNDDESSAFEFASPEHQDLVEASLCMLEMAYHRAGDLGRLSGAPHVLLHRLPPSTTIWRAVATLIDSDALAAQGRHDEAQVQLETLMTSFPEARIAVPAGRLLAWSYAQEGRDELAIRTEQSLLDRYGASIEDDALVSARLNEAHMLFNQKRYEDAAAAYERFLRSFPEDAHRLEALYQVGVCYTRLDRAGDAVDRWETLVREAPTAEIAERAWARAGDVYFQAEQFDDAKRCYRALLDTFGGGASAGLATLRLAQCDYNAGRDGDALEAYSRVVDAFPGTGFAAEAERGIERALYRLGQRDDSVDVLGQLVDRFPTSAFAADAQLEVASRLYEEKRFEEAAEAYRRVVTQFPGHDAADEAHFFMADALMSAGHTDEAARAFEQFVIFFPDSDLRPLVEFRVGTARFEAGDYLRAAVAFTSVLDGDADEETRAASLYNLALCKRLIGMRDEAIDLLERVRSEHTGEDARPIDVAYQLGDIRDEMGDTQAALSEFEAALAAGAKAPLATELHYRVGHCREQLGMTEGAVEAYRRAIAATPKSDPFRLSALVRCAALYEELGQLAKARHIYEDLASNAKDPELAAGASQRIQELSTVTQ